MGASGIVFLFMPLSYQHFKLPQVIGSPTQHDLHTEVQNRQSLQQDMITIFPKRVPCDAAYLHPRQHYMNLQFDQFAQKINSESVPVDQFYV